MPTRVSTAFMGVAYPAAPSKRRGGASAVAPKKRRETPEHPVHVTLKRYLEDVLPVGSIVFCIENEVVPVGKSEGARMHFFQKRKVRGVLNGMTDLGALLPGGRSFWLEVKAPADGVLSADQFTVHSRMVEAGHHVGTASCIEEARWALRQASVPLREAAGQAAYPWSGRVQRAKPAPGNLDIPF